MPTSRIERDLKRGRRAAARVRADGGSALAASYASIEAVFSPGVNCANFKDRVARLMQLGAAHPEVWTRYRRIAERYQGANLEAAIVLINRMRWAELEARAASARNWGVCARPRLTLMVLQEICLILRMIRRYASRRFPVLLASVLNTDFAQMEGDHRPGPGRRVGLPVLDRIYCLQYSEDSTKTVARIYQCYSENIIYK